MTNRDSEKDRKERPPTPDDGMSRKEKEDFETQVEEFEGPDRREIRGDHETPAREHTAGSGRKSSIQGSSALGP
jgi:hypothetical protein